MSAIKCACPKCSNDRFVVDEFHAYGGLISRIFGVSAKRFSAVTCTRCAYTEIYRCSASAVGNLLQSMAGS